MVPETVTAKICFNNLRHINNFGIEQVNVKKHPCAVTEKPKLPALINSRKVTTSASKLISTSVIYIFRFRPEATLPCIQTESSQNTRRWNNGQFILL